MFSLLVSLVSSECTELTRLSSQFLIAHEAEVICVNVSDSLFVNITTVDNKAVLAHEGYGSLSVTMCSFYRCIALGTCWGGAISKVNAIIFASFCCLHQCRTPETAMAIVVEAEGATIADTNFYLCGGPDIPGRGTLAMTRALPGYFSRLNFSDDQFAVGSSSGSALFSDRSQPAYTDMSYCTFVRCIGASIIEIPNARSTTGQSRINNCNFIDNTVSGSKAMIYMYSAGFEISFCVFGAGIQLGVRLIAMSASSPTAEAKFYIDHCVFPVEPQISVNIFSSDSCSIDPSPLPLSLSHFIRCYAEPEASPCATPTATKMFTYSGKWNRSGRRLFISYGFAFFAQS
jgi:hypothetical protein